MTETGITESVSLKKYSAEMRKELDVILNWWMHNTHDAVNGGFIGRVDEDNVKYSDAPKGAVLNSRILWAFSAGYDITRNPDHLYLARLAYNYLSAHFIDPKYGGMYWAVDAKGRPLDTKKQIYALAFGIYGCCAYYTASNNQEPKETAISLYRQIEQYSFDPEYGGYYEAFTRDWHSIDDLRLSAKDANEKKTMNTHLHILEAYTNLYLIWPDEDLKKQLTRLLQIFIERIFDEETNHLSLFFSQQWEKRSSLISYGHDIEAAWLLPRAASVLGNEALIFNVNGVSRLIATAAVEGLDDDGGLWYEQDPVTGLFVKEKHWWVQAESMVGFFDQWQQTGEGHWLDKSYDSWKYTRHFIKDKVQGEWIWGRDEWGKPMAGEDKAGTWKCPYHNSRACIEIINRVAESLK